MENEPKLTNKIDEAMKKFSIAQKSLQKTIENLNKTYRNLQNAKKNFDQYKTSKQNDHSLTLSHHFGIPSLDEKAKFLESQFNACFIQDETNELIIILEDTKFGQKF